MTWRASFGSSTTILTALTKILRQLGDHSAYYFFFLLVQAAFLGCKDFSLQVPNLDDWAAWLAGLGRFPRGLREQAVDDKESLVHWSLAEGAQLPCLLCCRCRVHAKGLTNGLRVAAACL